jgi:diguanylate cyclase (GGDEF)-like protein
MVVHQTPEWRVEATRSSDAPSRILIAEDDPSTSELLQEFLSANGFEVAVADSGAAAIDELKRQEFDLVLSDLAMPDGDGFELVTDLRAMGHVDLPFILMSANYETVLRVKGLNLGADDFVLKPIDLDELLARVHSQLRRSDRQLRLARDTMLDPLTQVLNRRGLAEQFELERARLRRRGGSMAVLLIDLDHFKEVNDQHGHAAGDLVLCETGKTLRSASRGSDRVGRLGGDEFVVLMPDADAQQASILAQRIRASSPLEVRLPDQQLVRVGFSAGVAAAGADAQLERLIEAADAAMYAEKRRTHGERAGARVTGARGER